MGNTEYKKKLEERNIYLSIISDINRSILESKVFNDMLEQFLNIFFHHLLLKKGVYYRYDFQNNVFNASVGIQEKNGKKLWLFEKDLINTSFTLNNNYKIFHQNSNFLIEENSY